MKLWERVVVIPCAVVVILILYIWAGVSLLLGNGKPSGS